MSDALPEELVYDMSRLKSDTPGRPLQTILVVVALATGILSCEQNDSGGSAELATRSGRTVNPVSGEVAVKGGVLHIVEKVGNVTAQSFTVQESDWRPLDVLKPDTFRKGYTYQLRFELLDDTTLNFVAKTAQAPCQAQVFFIEENREHEIKIPVCMLATPEPAKFPTPDGGTTGSGLGRVYEARQAISIPQAGFPPCEYFAEFFRADYTGSGIPLGTVPDDSGFIRTDATMTEIVAQSKPLESSFVTARFRSVRRQGASSSCNSADYSNPKDNLEEGTPTPLRANEVYRP